MSTKSVQARLERLEVLEQQRELRRRAERIARDHNVPVEEVLLQLEEIAERIARDGLDAEIARMARELGKTEDDMRAEYDRAVAEIAAEDEPAL